MTVLERIRKPKILSQDALLLKQYKLTKGQLLVMMAWGIALGQLAAPIGSAIYYLGTQRSYSSQGKDGSNITLVGSVKPGDWWDRLPNHIQAILGDQVFGITSATAPPWWVTARHDIRHVLIGFIIAMLVGSVTVGLKKYKRRSTWQMIASVPLALLAAGAVATALIAGFDRITPAINTYGANIPNPWVQNWIGSGLAITAIGIAAGFVAKKILAPTFATIQLLSIEDRIGENRGVPRWFPPNYQRRHDYLVASGYKGESHGKWMGTFLALSMPFLFALALYGGWLLYLGPAAHAH